MGRTVQKDILTTPPSSLPNTSIYGYEYLTAGKSLTATLTVVDIAGVGWFDFIAITNRLNGTGVDVVTETHTVIEVDGQRATSCGATTTYAWMPVYGYIATNGTDLMSAAPVPFRSSLKVMLSSRGTEAASYSLNLAIKYGTL